MTHPSPDGALDATLTQAILARTSGSPCLRLRTLACDLQDGNLSPALTTLAQGHLEHCPACRDLLAKLAEAATLLPELALVDPGPAFTHSVLALTRSGPGPGPSFHATWLRLLKRPRLCLEAAYLGTVAGVITLHLPMPGLQNPAALIQTLRPHAGAAPLVQAARARSQGLQQRSGTVINQQCQRLHGFWGKLRSTLQRWLQRCLHPF